MRCRADDNYARRLCATSSVHAWIWIRACCIMMLTPCWSPQEQKPCIFCFPPGRIFGFSSFCSRIQHALCIVRALTVSVEMFFACAFDEAITCIVSSSGDEGGQMKTVTSKTSFYITWVLPDLLCPRRSKLWVRRCFGGLLWFPKHNRTLSQIPRRKVFDQAWAYLYQEVFLAYHELNGSALVDRLSGKRRVWLESEKKTRRAIIARSNSSKFDVVFFCVDLRCGYMLAREFIMQRAVFLNQTSEFLIIYRVLRHKRIIGHRLQGYVCTHTRNSNNSLPKVLSRVHFSNANNAFIFASPEKSHWFCGKWCSEAIVELVTWTSFPSPISSCSWPPPLGVFW